MRAEYWYLFGLIALIVIAMRWQATRRANLRDPMALSFTLTVFLAAFGALSKVPPVAAAIDRLFGPNAAWLQADILFLAAMCAGTIWIDMMLQPALKERGWRLLVQRRVGLLALVAAWMITAARLEAPLWSNLERGTVNMEGSLALLSSRLAYFGYNIWVLSYLAWGLYRARRLARDRVLYVRLTLPYVGFAVAVTAPVVQVVGLAYAFIWPTYFEAVWPRLWVVFTAAQTTTYVMMLLALWKPGYEAVIWLDKQLLIQRLRRLCDLVGQTRPDLVSQRASRSLVARQPDAELAALVTEMEVVKHLLGSVEGIVEAPAGAVMPTESREALLQERAGLQQVLSSKPARFARVEGSTYALAWWYAALG